MSNTRMILLFLLVIFLLVVTFVCCSSGKNVEESEEEQLPDTVYIEVPELNSERIEMLEQEVEYWKSIVQDSLQTGTMSYTNYMNARKVEKVNYYISLCEKNSTNKKFFFGWIKRAMRED